MVPCAGLIVVAKHADAGDNVGKGVFEIVVRPPHWLRNPPNPQFHKRIRRELMAFMKQQRRLYCWRIYQHKDCVVNCSNARLNFAYALGVLYGATGPDCR